MVRELSVSARGFLTRYTATTFSSLKVRNYRLYFIGQGISLVGTWMQGIAQSWLVLSLTGSGLALGSVLAFQFLPVLVLGPYGGLLADRLPKRRILLITQTCAALLALVLTVLVYTDAVRLWMVFVLATGLGLVNAIDNPTRQSFVHELVGPDELHNAVTLNSLEVNMTRVLGPALAGALIAGIGLALCFLINALSFIGVIVCLAMMRPSELHHTVSVEPEKGQLRAGFAYVIRTPVIRGALIMMALVGTLTFEFPVTLGMLSKFTFHADAGSYAALTSALGVGAVLGGLATAGRKNLGMRGLTAAAFGFGATMLVVAIAPSLHLALVAMVAVGACSIAFTSLTNSILQLESDSDMRGRVMALWAVAFLGSTPLGAPVVGWIGEHFDPRASIVVGAAGAFFAGLVGLIAMRRHRNRVFGGAVAAPVTLAEKEEYV